MLGKLLHPLNQREQALLLTTLTFGGSGGAGLFSHLPEFEAERLNAKISMLEEIPREKRVPLMVRELRKLLTFRDRQALEGVEPSWLIAGFRGESPRTVAIVLMHMPSAVAKEIVDRLPKAIRQAMPARSELSGVPLEVVKLVRARFNAKFESMPLSAHLEDFGFRELVALSARELVTVVRKLGAEELACAFVTVGKRALAELLRRLSTREAEELISSVKRVAREDRMEAGAAQAFLGKVLDNFQNTDELFQKAGIWRLARAVASEDLLFARQLSQRFPRAHGRVLKDYLTRVNQRDDEIDGARIRNAILMEVIDLSRRGKIDVRYAQANPFLEK